MIDAAIPIFFGGMHHIAGWFTRGASTAGLRRSGVVLCPPVGHEYMCSYRAFRKLASDLASKGFPVLRFDYYGTGDSGSRVNSDSLVPSWNESISLAADELRRLSGCDTVALIGLRLGGTMAAIASAQRSDVDFLALWSPCSNGRSHMREARMLATATAKHEDLLPETEGVESVGFFFNEQTVADISRMRLNGTIPNARNVLLLTSDDAPADPSLSDAMSAGGARCDARVYSGQASFMVAPSESVLPVAAIDTIVQWCDETCPPTAAPPARGQQWSNATTSSVVSVGGIRESIVTLANGRLAGVITEPTGASTNPAVILLNSGAYHHVGPHRLYVPLARRWAGLGFPVMRLDLSGIGDSIDDYAQPTSDPYPASAMDDIRIAMEHLRDAKGYADIILAGMCSGAYHAVYGADLDVKTVIAVNPPLFHHAGDPIVPDPHYNNHAETGRVIRALWKPAKWRRLVGGEVDLRYTADVLARRVYETSREYGMVARQIFRKRETTGRRDPLTLFRDTVTMHFIFNEGDKSQVFFERYLSRRLTHLKKTGKLTVETVSGADHTFMPIRWQRVLADLMTERLLLHRTATSHLDRTVKARAARI